MENRLTRWVYNHSPDALRDVYCSAYGLKKQFIRYGGHYKQWCSFFQKAHGWSEDRLRAVQEEKLRSLVAYCWEHVPYYRRRWELLGLRRDDIRQLGDLERLPILEKADVREAGQSLLSRLIDPRNLLQYPTSGSTGTPLRLYRSRSMENMEFAFVWTRNRIGMRHGDPWSLFSGLEIVPPERKRPPFWRNNWAARERMFSIFHMNEKNLEHYVQALDQRYSKFYSGYSSALYLIVNFMERYNLRLHRPPAAFFPASEELQPEYEDAIRRTLGCEVWNRYALGEMAGSITQYSCGHMHYDMDYSIIEFLPVGEEDGLIRAEVIGTTLHDHCWPLIRYRTGDLVLINPEDRCNAAIPGQIVRRIYGRTGNYFLLPDGTRICNISVIAKQCRHVRLMQVVQEIPGAIRVRVVRDENYTSKDEQVVIAQFRKKVGHALKITVEYVENIERTSRGKYLSIINRLSSGGEMSENHSSTEARI